MRAAQTQPVAYQVDVVGVAEFNSSYRGFQRSICKGEGGGGAGACAEPRNSCGQEAAGSGSDPPIAIACSDRGVTTRSSLAQIALCSH